MFVIIRDVKGKKVELEISSNKITVKDLKNEFKKKTGIDSNNIDFILNGSELDNEKTLESYEIDENSIIIYLSKNNLNNNQNQLNNTELEIEKEEKKINSNNNINQESNLNIKNENKDDDNILNEQNNENNENDENKINLPKELRKIGIFMKILTYKEPDKMNTILNNIKNTNRSLLERIKEKKDIFIEFLQKPITKEDLDYFKQNYQDAKSLLDIGDIKNKEGKIEIFLTQEETDDIQKLKSIGFSLEDSIEAYVINDLNGEKAAIYLLNKYKNNKSNKDYDINGVD
jgi:hypothetical protein